MLDKEYHRLLKRQLKKTGLNIQNNPQLLELLELVNSAYKDFDKDSKHVQNILEESSKELYILNKKLILERDDTKKQLEYIIDNVGGIIFETDDKGYFTFLNSAWENYSDTPVKDSIGKNVKTFIEDAYIDNDIDIEDIFSNRKQNFNFIFRYNKPNKVMWFEAKAKRINDKKGKPLGYIGSIIDITNLKEIEIELKKASKTKDEFFSTMSHEIRTPLNAVTGLTNILLMEEYLPDQVENFKALKYSGEHLLGLINDLLDFDKIKSGKLNLIEKDFSLDYFLENVKSDLKLRAERKNLNFQVLKANNVPNNIIGDELKLSQVIKNLLNNALKFTETGSIILNVENKGIEENKVKLLFKVIDTGIGISKDRQKNIFESFVQADSQTSIKYGGTGLGLSISKKLLQLQNTDLEVKSEIGKGATFSFIITYKISNKLDLYSPKMISEQPNYQPLNINVLIAEDNKMNVLILKRLFKNWQVNFIIAENGEQVLKLYEDFDFDLILMDIQMPILNGYKTTTKIRNLKNKAKANIPIIALTALAQTDIKEKTERYKMNGFMGKPFNPEKLYNLLKFYTNKTINKHAF